MKNIFIFSTLIILGLCSCCNKHKTASEEAQANFSYSLLGTFSGRQAGCSYQDYLFRFNTDNTFNVYHISSGEKIGKYQLDGDLLPHCNTACFGNEKYNAEDQFPLLYVNAYNTAGLPKGTCYVHRLGGNEAEGFSTTLVQTISIDFTEDTLWTNGSEDTRPYGNFAVDAENNLLYVYTLRDTEQTTRFFKFALPKLENGDRVTLTKADIIDHFDCDYFKHIQDNCCHNGMLYLCTGYGIEEDLAYIRLVDPTAKAEVVTINLNDAGLVREPEYIDFHNDTLLYGMGRDSVYCVALRF